MRPPAQRPGNEPRAPPISKLACQPKPASFAPERSSQVKAGTREAPHGTARRRARVARKARSGYLREHGITLTYDPASGTLQSGTAEATKTTIRKAS
jgi:hypothetical protein